MKPLAQGAEATLYIDNDTVVKQRTVKSYRHPDIDNRLRKSRTKREAKVLAKLKDANISVPKLISTDNKETIVMEKLPGMKLRDFISRRNFASLAPKLAKNIASIHNQNIIHGDLTTSNMIIDKKTKEISMIDFGLSFFSHKVEDKATDLHVLEEALESTHPQIADKLLEITLQEYQKCATDAKIILERLEKVRKRGRYAKH